MTEPQIHRSHYYGDPNMLIDLLACRHILSLRTWNCLKNDSIVFLGDLIHRGEGDMLRAPNFGKKSLNELKEFLQNIGNYNFASKSYVSEIVRFGDDKSKIVEMYGLSEDAKPTYDPTNPFKPSQVKFTSLVNSEHTPPIFTEDDFEIASYEISRAPEAKDDKVSYIITLPEVFNNLIKDGHIDLKNDEITGIIRDTTKSSNHSQSTPTSLLLQYYGESLKDLATVNVLEGFAKAADIIVPQAQKRAIDHLERKIEERYGVKIS